VKAPDPANAPDPADARREVVTQLQTSRRYRAIDPATLARIAAEQIERHPRDLPAAVKGAKRQLHQIFGAYFPSPPRYPALLRPIEAAARTADAAALRQALRRALLQHASTAERVDHLDAFYERLFAAVGPARRIVDLACGFHPLSAPWMPVRWHPVEYRACDIDRDLLAFVDQAARAIPIPVACQVVDLVGTDALPGGDVTLLLKSLPCLEQQAPGSSRRLIERIESPVLVASFPTRSLGGHRKGMFQTYSQGFEQLVAGKPWRVQSFEVGPELVYVVDRR
jgi:16S rRNA (guanine(1405)-N(7))-methyltransferase